EPLFSTKVADRGSGLGLAMVRQFAETGRGALTIDSVEGRGTRVRIYLPCTEKLAETTANMTLPLSTLPGGEESLVLLSRDRDVRMSVQQILEALGYTVVAVDTGDGVEQAMSRSPAPDLIISERSLTAVRVERRWLDELKNAHPKVRHLALLQAGTAAHEAAPDADGHVYRPVNIAELARTVRNVLEKSDAQS
ncbi:MAG: ATP-binding protein, partial [Woeseia sp.]